MEEDEDLVAAIAREPDFWKVESVREALLEIIQHQGPDGTLRYALDTNWCSSTPRSARCVDQRRLG